MSAMVYQQEFVNLSSAYHSYDFMCMDGYKGGDLGGVVFTACLFGGCLLGIVSVSTAKLPAIRETLELICGCHTCTFLGLNAGAHSPNCTPSSIHPLAKGVHQS